MRKGERETRKLGRGKKERRMRNGEQETGNEERGMRNGTENKKRRMRNGERR